MINYQMLQLVKGGLKNAEFLNAIAQADGSTPPGQNADDIDKVVFASIYYGWLVGKYGAAGWQQYLPKVV